MLWTILLILFALCVALDGRLNTRPRARTMRASGRRPARPVQMEYG